MSNHTSQLSDSTSLHATQDTYQLLFFCRVRTVERYYTAVGTSEKNSAKFMPFALEKSCQKTESFSPEWKDVAGSWTGVLAQQVPTVSRVSLFTSQVNWLTIRFHTSASDSEGGVKLLKLARVRVSPCSLPMFVCLQSFRHHVPEWPEQILANYAHFPESQRPS